MRKWLNIYFDFSKREYNGLLVMILIIALVHIIPAVYESLFPEREDLLAETAAIRKLSIAEGKKSWAARYKYADKRNVDGRLFNFDPNKISSAEWQLLGLSAKQAAVILRYIAKGGRFRKREDLKKMYPVSPELYERLERYICIPERDSLLSLAYHQPSVYFHVPRLPVTVLLNTADSAELVKVKGIGPAFARRIVKYRERLGGFYKKEQLMEIYGLDSIRYEEIKDQLRIDLESVKMIRINSVLSEDLRHHPYLTYKEVNAIVQYRKQHGNYSNIADMKKVAILTAEKAEQLAPYISFDHD